MNLVRRVAITAGLAIAALAVAAPAFAHDDDDFGWKHKRHGGHHRFVPPGHVYYYRAPPVVYERPVIYRAMPDYSYYGPPPPSLNINIPLR
jgi:hypothetical protein